MDFSRPHILEESVATKSKIKYIDIGIDDNKTKEGDDLKKSLDNRLVQAANRAAQDLLLGPPEATAVNPRRIDASLYPDRLTPQSETIQAGTLVVIFESFDNLDFVYVTPPEVFSNRNGNFHHSDFIGKPFGCKIRSNNNRGFGYCYLLKPTPELWARSLNHRTQIVHELDASMIVFYLNLKPNMVVCETGTGSGAMSHGIMRTIAPFGKLHTFEFNKVRADQARQEFAKNGLSHLVNVYHKDVCGKASVTLDDDNDKDDSKPTAAAAAAQQGGFGLEGGSVSAIFLDLPEPWLAVPHAAYCMKANGRIASYSPCMEQTQRTVQAMTKAGFHSHKTMEFRIRENYVDEVEYELPPPEKRIRFEAHTFLASTLGEAAIKAVNETVVNSGGEDISAEDTGAEADNEKSEISETEADQLSLATAGTVEEMVDVEGKGNNAMKAPAAVTTPSGTTASPTVPAAGKRKKILVARPFVNMRGHTAFLTFATAGNVPQPDPNA